MGYYSNSINSISITTKKIKKQNLWSQTKSTRKLSDLELIMDYDKLDEYGCGIVLLSFVALEEVLKNEDTSESVKKDIKEDIEKSRKEGKDYVEYYFY